MYSGLNPGGGGSAEYGGGASCARAVPVRNREYTKYNMAQMTTNISRVPKYESLL